MGNKISNVIKNPSKIFAFFAVKGCFKWVPDKPYLKIMYRAQTGKRLDVINPLCFNEKLQWLKLYDRNDTYTEMVDKLSAKKYIEKIIGHQYVIPTLGIWDSFDEIDFSQLPNQFVLKCTHDSGGLYICKDKQKIDYDKVKKKINKSLKYSFYYRSREWPYKNVPPRIIAEKYLENSIDRGLDDYKVHNFNGEPKIILVCRDRYEKTGITEDFYSLDWEHLDIKRPGAAYSESPIDKPERLEEMLEISRKLSNGIPFLRTDFYVVDHQLYVGELTFFPASGFKRFVPDEWDSIMGKWLELPQKKQSESTNFHRI